MIFLDCEVYRDYFLCLLLNDRDMSVKMFELYEGHADNMKELARIMQKHTTCGFNSQNYDCTVIAMAVAGKTTQEIYRGSKRIIEMKMRPRDVWPVPKSWDHIDISEVAPGPFISLKQYGGRMHTKRLQDLPYDPNAVIDEVMRKVLRKYCRNDLTMTMELFNMVREQIKLRESMTKQYGVDLRSKSDAQIAEAVLVKEIEAATKDIIQRPFVMRQSSKYRTRPWLKFMTPELQQVLQDTLATEFTTTEKGILEMPEVLSDRKITIGNSTYKMGIGGLHSTESCVSHYATGNRQLIDIDVASYYPFIILEQGLYPPQCGPMFLTVYKSIVDRRIAAKKAKDTVTADSLKITINGSFGKLGSAFSKLYAPDLFKQVTITGQLAMLMLIERLHLAGIEVVSANTDGIVTYPYDHQVPVLDQIVKEWESATSFSTERTFYSSIHNRDVNSYIAFKTDGKVKTKGFFAETSLAKTPAMEIIAKSVVKHLQTGEPLSKLVREGQPHDYVTVRKVTAGGMWNNKYLGKIVRWYWSTEGAPILSIKKGDKVATSDGAYPAMTLPETLPPTLDYARYEKAAVEALAGLGTF